MNKNEVFEMLKTIKHYYWNFPTSEETASAWAEFFQDAEKEVIMKNLIDHVKYEVYPPTIADLLKVKRPREIDLLIEKLEREERENG